MRKGDLLEQGNVHAAEHELGELLAWDFGGRSSRL